MIDEINAPAKARRSRRVGGRPNQNLPFASVFAFFASSRLYFIGLIALLAADAPSTPFYYASSTPFDRQISTLIVGANSSIGQAVVSQDRKYVTLNMDPSLLGNARIGRFKYQKGGLGFVGSSGTPAAPVAGGNTLTPSIVVSPSDIAPQVSLLDTPGMVLIEPLER